MFFGLLMLAFSIGMIATPTYRLCKDRRTPNTNEAICIGFGVLFLVMAMVLISIVILEFMGLSPRC